MPYKMLYVNYIKKLTLNILSKKKKNDWSDVWAPVLFKMPQEMLMGN